MNAIGKLLWVLAFALAGPAVRFGHSQEIPPGAPVAPETATATAAPAETAAPAPEAGDPVLPLAVESSHFEHLLTHSPFVRTLNLAETFALRGIAEINGEQVATLFNRETNKSVVVTASRANAERMQLKSVTEAESLTGISALIAVAGEEVELKFEPERIAPLPKNPKGTGPGSSGKSPGGSGGEERRGPSPQDVERYKSLPPEKQEKLREYIRQSMQSYPNMSREERGNLIRGAMTRLIDGGEISMPQASPGSASPTPPPPPSGGSGSGSSDRDRSRDRGGR